MTRTCVGACGLMSSKANTCSSSKTFFAGISPRRMRQKRQLLAGSVIAGSPWGKVTLELSHCKRGNGYRDFVTNFANGSDPTFHVPSKGLSKSVRTKSAKNSSIVVTAMDTNPSARLRKGKKKSKNRIMDAVSVTKAKSVLGIRFMLRE